VSGRPRHVTDEEFSAYLGVEKTGIDTVSPWQKKDRPQKQSGRQPTRSPKQSLPVIHKKASELLDMEKVIFSCHSLNRLVERMGALDSPQVLKDPEETARKLLADSKEAHAISSVGKVKRLINNDFVDVRYFVNSFWRFVLKPEEDGSFIVLTVERIDQ